MITAKNRFIGISEIDFSGLETYYERKIRWWNQKINNSHENRTLTIQMYDKWISDFQDYLGKL